MSSTAAGVVFIVTLIAALALAYKPFGDYMYRVVTPTKHSRVERGIYKVVGVDPRGEQSWGVYARSVLAFSAVSILVLYAMLRLQEHIHAIAPAGPKMLRSPKSPPMASMPMPIPARRRKSRRVRK